jgi:glycopeptide antibiotics resistance protein
MARLFSGFWVGFTVVLCVIFAGLFYPMIREKYDFLLSIAFTVAGVCLIWVVYFVRAHIFSRMEEDQENRKNVTTRSKEE